MARFEQDKMTIYSIEKYAGMWTPEGLEYYDKQEALEELEFHRKLYPQEKWRLTSRQATVVWRRD